MKTGTTTVGIVCKDCVILAADKRATAGHFIACKDESKVRKINDNMAVTIAGSVSDIQMLLKYLRAELRLRQYRTGIEPSVRESATLLASWVYHNIRTPSMMPGVTQFLFAGKDQEGLHLYDIFPDGTISYIKDFFSSGSGSTFAFGLLETNYHKDMSEEEGIDLALKCINAALQRDSASGNGVDLFIVNQDGAKKVMTKKINTGLIS